MQNTITTERLVLSPPADGDVDAIYDACQDPEIARWTTVPPEYTRAHAIGFISVVETGWREGSEYIWAIRHDDRLLGVIGLHHVRNGIAEIGYWMSPQARGNGYLLEAARAVVDAGFASTDPQLVRIQWHAVVGNVPSARTARSLGFHFEGTRRQALWTDHRGHDDGWSAALLRDDDRRRQHWPVLD